MLSRPSIIMDHPELGGLRAPKVRPGHVRDFWAYIRWHRLSVSSAGGSFSMMRRPDIMPYHPAAPSALLLFVLNENVGWTRSRGPNGGRVCYAYSTKHPKLLACALAGKRELHAQMQQWVEGVREGLFVIDELVPGHEFLPEWVWREVERRSAGYRVATA